MLGTTMAAPVLLAPSGVLSIVHEEAETPLRELSQESLQRV